DPFGWGEKLGADLIQLFVVDPQSWDKPQPHPRAEQILASPIDVVVGGRRFILRRAGQVNPAPPRARLRFADIELDDDTHEVWKSGAPVSLSPTEFTLLRYFIVNAGTVLSKPRILDHVWRYDFGGEVGVVETYVSYLRKKVDTGEQRLIHTLRGVGYVLREPDSGRR
uniref:winged helix-turn-helix domain-containing protein n=1 Tax=Nocardia cyriacigeorgica TaxID=135487 RepID=UPI002453D90D